MNYRFPQAAFSPANSVTILSPAHPGARAQVCCPKRDIADASGPRLSNETQDLLRTRLRAAALILLIGFSVFLLRHVVGILLGEPLYPVLLVAHVLVVLVLGFSSMPLCRQCPVSMPKLRVAELIIF